jgi:hypothetical protein
VTEAKTQKDTEFTSVGCLPFRGFPSAVQLIKQSKRTLKIKSKKEEKLISVIQIVVLSVIIWSSALLQNRVDTERKRVEEKLKEYREHLEEILVRNHTYVIT